MQQSFEGLQTAATAKFGWRMKHTGSSSTPRNDRLLHIDYLWIAGCSIQDWPTLCVHAIVVGMQIGRVRVTKPYQPTKFFLGFGSTQPTLSLNTCSTKEHYECRLLNEAAAVDEEAAAFASGSPV